MLVQRLNCRDARFAGARELPAHVRSSDGRIGPVASSTRATRLGALNGRCRNCAAREIIRRESVWWVRSAVRAGLLFGCNRFLTRNNRSYCRWGWIQYQAEAPMRFEKLSFGSIRIDGTMYE